jgi:hypothetical protein
MGLTQEVANFVSKPTYRDIPKEVVELARGFILDEGDKFSEQKWSRTRKA